MAFSPSSSDGGLSGDLGQLLTEDGLGELALQPSLDRAVGTIALNVGDVRGEGLTVHHEPVVTNWYHGGVRDFGGASAKKKKQKRLQQLATQLVPVDQDEAKRLVAEREADIAAKAAA